MTQDELLRKLYLWRETAKYNIFSQQCLQKYFSSHQNEEIPFHLPGIAMLDGRLLTLETFTKNNDRNLLEIKKEANRFVTRNWLKETFRLVQSHYAKEDLEEQDWYQFARLSVNAMSHDWCYRFKKEDKRHLPASYNGEAITKDMEGKPFSMLLEMAYNLVEEILKYVENN